MRTDRKRWPVAAVVVAALLGALVLAGPGHPLRSAGAAGGKGIPQVTVVVRDGQVDAPRAVPTGLVAITFENRSAAPYTGALLQLNPGVSAAAFSVAIPSEGFAAFRRLVAASLGGPAFVAPGESRVLVVEFGPGTHLLTSTGQDGPPSVQAVIEATPPLVGDVPPVTQGTVVMGDFFFQTPAIAAGTSTIALTNRSRQPHHMLVFRLAAGVTVQQALAAEAQGDDPLESGLLMPATGVETMTPGQTVYPTLTFTPGTYAMVCFVQDPATGLPHVALGMVEEFTVR